MRPACRTKASAICRAVRAQVSQQARDDVRVEGAPPPPSRRRHSARRAGRMPRAALNRMREAHCASSHLTCGSVQRLQLPW